MGGTQDKELTDVSEGNFDNDNLTSNSAEIGSSFSEVQSASTTSNYAESKQLNFPPLRDIRGKLKNLIGNTDKLSESAQKIFAMGKVYLARNNSDVTQRDGFPSLFELFPENRSTGLNRHKDDDDDTDKAQSHNPSHGHQESLKLPPHGKTAIVTCAQTYVQWKAGHDLLNLNTLCFAPLKTIYLQPLDEFPEFCSEFKLHTDNLTLGFFDALQGFLQIFFSGMEIVILPPVSIPGDPSWRVRSRVHEVTKQEQYCVTDIFPYLQSTMPRNGHSIVGIVWTDLYPVDFNFVLGEASFVHKSAAVSFGRFEPNGFDASSHQDITEIDGCVMWKLLRTLSHELCHLFGLGHCVFFRCAMNESSSMTEALSQPLFLCPVCLRKLQQACSFDVLERYQLLLKFIQNICNQMSDSEQIKDSVRWLTKTMDYLNS